MKFSLFFAVLFLSLLVSNGQEVQFPPAIVSSGGGNTSSNPVSLTRWRIGQINVLTLPASENFQKVAIIDIPGPSGESGEAFEVAVYPNPVTARLNIRFDMESRNEFSLEVYDLQGRKIREENSLIMVPGQVAEMDLTGLVPALYFLKITPANKSTHKLIKITKQ